MTVTADQISDADTNDPPDGLAADVDLLVHDGCRAAPGSRHVIINELDADTPGIGRRGVRRALRRRHRQHAARWPGGRLLQRRERHGQAVLRGVRSRRVTARTRMATSHWGIPASRASSLMFDPGEFGLLSERRRCGRALHRQRERLPQRHERADREPAGRHRLRHRRSGRVGSAAAAERRAAEVNENATGTARRSRASAAPTAWAASATRRPTYPGAPTPGAGNTCPAARPPTARRDQPALWRRRQRRRHLSQRLRRAVQPRHQRRWTSAAGRCSTPRRRAAAGIPTGSRSAARSDPASTTSIALASGGADGAALPPANISRPDQHERHEAARSRSSTASTGWSATVRSAIRSMMDFVGYGSADCGEGSTTTPAPSNTTALFRAGQWQHRHRQQRAATSPRRRRRIRAARRRSSSSGRWCWPPIRARTALNAPRDATIQVTFTEPVDVIAAWFDITCASSGPHNSATFAVGSAAGTTTSRRTTTSSPASSAPSRSLKDQVHDQDLDDSGANTDTLPADYVLVVHGGHRHGAAVSGRAST